jgi:alpha-D-xyloside xylohydrolase
MCPFFKSMPHHKTMFASKRRFIGTCCFFLLLAVNLLYGQSPYQRLPDGIAVRLDSLRVRLRVCDSRTIRVIVTSKPAQTFRPSLAINKTWLPALWRAELQDSVALLYTGKVLATVNLRSGAVEFRDLKRTLLVREAPARPHEITPAVVSGEKSYHVRQRFMLSRDEAIYGLGQFEYGMMNYRGRHVTLIQNNRHVCVPFLISTRKYGIYWDNYSHTEFNDDADGMSLWSEVGDGIDYYFIAGSTMDDVIAGYREATGRAPLLPRWAFGYWQSKERYENEDQLMSVAREYRRRQLPVDNIVQDWQYWGRLGWNAMAFDDSLFPHPKKMIDSLHQLYNLHLMISIWPQVDSATAVFKALAAKGHLFPTPIWNSGKTYDAYSKEARDIYWKHLNQGLYSLGVDSWWVDATEPDWKWCDSLLEEKEGIVMNGMTAIGTSSRYLNPYALMTTTGIYENQRKANPHRRVMMLTRSAFAGQQRNSMAMWSGDISSTWKVFRNQIAGGVNFSMAGIPYWNSDIGGFLPKEFGGEYPLGPRDPAYKELYVRWFQFGAFCPIFRAHGTDFPREIWQFGEPGDWAYDALVKYDRLRYRLLPYIYSVAWQVTNIHSTMMRGLPLDFVDDSKTYNINNEYMFGPSILVAPVTSELYYPRLLPVGVPPVCLLSTDSLRGLTGHYFRGEHFDTLDHVQRDSVIQFDWTRRGAPGVGKAHFTVRWEGKLRAPETGKYEFEVTSDDGVNLWIDGQQIMDEMYPAGLQRNYADAEFKAGSLHDIKLEYQQVDKGAAVTLGWRTPAMLASYTPKRETQPWQLYLPATTAWVDFWTGETVAGGRDVEEPAPLDILPLYLKAGAIVPLGPVMQYSTEKPADPVELRIYPGADGRFTLYEDQNDGYGYEKGVYAEIPMAWDNAKRQLTIGKRRGTFPGILVRRTFNLVLVGTNHGVGDGETMNPDKVITYSGSEMVVNF